MALKVDSRIASASWKKVLQRNAIKPVQQFAYSTGKNSTDSTLIIDAMDLLYTGNFDGFALVTSDSDFTGLAMRLREEGLTVYGFGERKTSYLEDIAILTGAQVVKDELGLQLDKVGEEVLGVAAKVEVSKEACTIVGDGTTEDAVKARVSQIRNLIADTEQE